jgi:hypothetical protein
MSYSPTGTAAGTVAAGNDSRITGAATATALTAEAARAEAAEALLLPLAGGTVTGALAIDGNTTVSGELSLNSGASITFGAAADTDLYRLSAGTLQTDGGFNILGYAYLANQLEVAGDVTTDSGNLVVSAAGKGVTVKEGSNARMGVTGAMTSGTITVANTSVTATSRVFLTAQTTGGAPGALRVSARTPGVSFTITSSSSSDTSTVAYLLMEPS